MRFRNFIHSHFLVFIFYSITSHCAQANQIDHTTQKGMSLANAKSFNKEIKEELQCVCKELDSVLHKEKTIINKIDQCCTTLHSKIDLALEGIMAICDISPITSKIDSCCEQLQSDIDAISSQIDICSHTLTSTIQSVSSSINNLVISCCDNILAVDSSIISRSHTAISQIDMLDNNIVQCCLTLNSKIDDLRQGITVDVSCDFSTITSKLDTCCNLLSSKIERIEDGLTVTAICDLSSVISKLDQCCITVTSKIDQTDAIILACCATLNSKVESLVNPPTSCNPIPITAATTLLAPGVYCLSGNISSTLATTIEIGAHNITLDLNGYNISNDSSSGTGIGLSNSASNVTIKNGSLQKLTSGASSTGINLSLTGTSSNVRIENVFISDWNLGITGSQLESIIIQQCIIRNNNSHGIFIDASENIYILQSVIKVNNGDGIRLNNSTQSVIDTCTINANENHGIYITATSIPGSGAIKICQSTLNQNSSHAILADQSSDCIEIYNCNANLSLPATGIFGFATATASNVLIKGSSACGFDHGFSITDSSGVNLLNNVAKGNITGFYTDSGQGILTSNTADNNTTGFNSIAGDYEFYSNTSCQNSINYAGSITSAPITSPANALGAENIDCANTTPDQLSQIESTLDSCCMELNSKLDFVITTTFVTPCDLTPVINQVNECCTTIESKIIELALCAPIAITSSTSISLPGHYCLANSISNVGPIITITGAQASHISLDLNGKILSATTGQCILVDSLTTHTGISIYNGTLTSPDGSADGIDINLTTVAVSDIELRNISFHELAIGFMASIGEQIIIENCNFQNNESHVFITNAQDIQIANSLFTNATIGSGCGFNTCSNVLIDRSIFTSSHLYGLNLLNVTNALLKNSMFNANGIDDAGLALAGCSDIVAQSCMFGTQNNPTQQSFGVSIGDSNSNITFKDSSFNANSSDGVAIQASIACDCLKFVRCQANGNQRYGYRVFGNITDVVFDSCTTCSNAAGFRVENMNTISPSNICFNNSIAKQNQSAGFSLVNGTGLLKENIAVDNGSCGFDDFVFTTSNFSYVANVAKNNGATPAGISDTNYCLASVGSSFIGNGPGTFPYLQVSLDLPPSSYWNNITLP